MKILDYIQQGIPGVEGYLAQYGNATRKDALERVKQVLVLEVEKSQGLFRRSQAGECVGMPEDIHQYILDLENLSLWLDQAALEVQEESVVAVTPVVETMGSPLEETSLVQKLDTSKEFLNVEELASLVGWSVKTVQNKVSEGGIPVIKGGRPRFERKVILEWLEAGRPRPDSWKRKKGT